MNSFMMGKARELGDTMQRRKVDILCVQDARWKGSKAGRLGDAFKFYHVVEVTIGVVGVILK